MPKRIIAGSDKMERDLIASVGLVYIG